MISSSSPPATECVRVVCGGIPETTELLRNKFDYIFYTGSGNVGKIIGAAAAKHITPCTLELGGKSPVYMDESCDMKMAVKRLIWGKASNNGLASFPGWAPRAAAAAHPPPRLQARAAALHPPPRPRREETPGNSQTATAGTTTLWISNCI